MKFKIIGRRYDVTDKIRDYVEKKLGKLDKFFKDESEARVVIGTIFSNFCGEVPRKKPCQELTFSVASEIMIILKLQFMRQV